MVASCTALNQVHRLWSAGTRWLTLEYCSRLLLQRGPKGSSRPQLFLRTSPRGPRAAHVRQFRHRGLLHACVHMYPPSVAVCNINIHLAQERCREMSTGLSRVLSRVCVQAGASFPVCSSLQKSVVACCYPWTGCPCHTHIPLSSSQVWLWCVGKSGCCTWEASGAGPECLVVMWATRWVLEGGTWFQSPLESPTCRPIFCGAGRGGG